MSLLKLKLPLRTYKVSGHSMEPTLLNGQIVWVNQWGYLFKKPKIGQIIIFEKNGKDFVKRVTRVEQKQTFVKGDNKKDSLDSTSLGGIDLKKIVGQVVGS